MSSIDPINARSDGVYEIVFDGGLHVEVVELTGSQFVIRSELAQLPDDKNDWRPVLSEYLSGNLLLLREQSNVLSLDQNTGTIYLHRMLRSNEVSVYEFCEIVSQFVTTLEWWNNRSTSSDATTVSAFDLMPQNFIRP